MEVGSMPARFWKGALCVEFQTTKRENKQQQQT
jgi:hypothetical protein